MSDATTPAPPTTTVPDHPLASATKLARVIREFVGQQGLVTEIAGRPYVRVEGWTTLAALQGVTAREVSVVEQDGVYVATVELRRVGDDTLISRASAECGAADEVDREGRPIWADRPRYARRSMAITRAVGKACRLAYSWIMVLAGYEPTPAEELEPLVSRLEPAPRTPTLPGDSSAWGGWGGKPLTEVPVEILQTAAKWCARKDAQRFRRLIAAIDDELARRQPAETKPE